MWRVPPTPNGASHRGLCLWSGRAVSSWTSGVGGVFLRLSPSPEVRGGLVPDSFLGGLSGEATLVLDVWGSIGANPRDQKTNWYSMRRWVYRRRCKQKSLRNRLMLLALKKRRAGHKGNQRRHMCRWKFGSWNVRRWGATAVPYDPWTKTQSLFRLANQRGWQAMMLSDVGVGNNSNYQVCGGGW